MSGLHNTSSKRGKHRAGHQGDLYAESLFNQTPRVQTVALQSVSQKASLSFLTQSHGRPGRTLKMVRPKGGSKTAGALSSTTANQSMTYLGRLLALPALVLLFVMGGYALVVHGQRIPVWPPIGQTVPPRGPSTRDVRLDSNIKNSGGNPNANLSSTTTVSSVSVSGGKGAPSPGEAPLDTGGSTSPSPSPDVSSPQSPPELSASPRFEAASTSYSDPSVSPESDPNERSESASLPWMWIGIVGVVIVVIAVEVVHRRWR